MKLNWRGWRAKFWALAVTPVLLFTLFLPINVYADATYGDGTYGDCAYGEACSTTVTLPSGVEVAINLTDGQVIPPTGYTVTVTPLDGSTTAATSSPAPIRRCATG